METKRCPKCGHRTVNIERKEHCLFCGYCPEDEAEKRQNPDLFRKVILNQNREITALARKNLLSNLDGSLDYCHNRGMTDNIIEEWDIGYIPERFVRLPNFWAKRILFPIKSETGEAIIGFGGRKITTDDRPKYLNSPASQEYEKRKSLFGQWLVPEATEMVYLCEGYMDTISMASHGFQYPVASLGTALTDEQASWIHDRSLSVTICYDSDEAGQTATLRALAVLQKTGYSLRDIRILSAQDAKDVDEVLQKGGTFRDVSAVEYLLEKGEFDLLTGLIS